MRSRGDRHPTVDGVAGGSAYLTDQWGVALPVGGAGAIVGTLPTPLPGPAYAWDTATASMMLNASGAPLTADGQSLDAWQPSVGAVATGSSPNHCLAFWMTTAGGSSNGLVRSASHGRCGRAQRTRHGARVRRRPFSRRSTGGGASN